MAEIDHKIPYAINRKNELVYVMDVPNGNSCDCICPSCKEPLCANQGNLRRYFSHISKKQCKGYLMSILHRKAQEFIKKEKEIKLNIHGDIKKFNFKEVFLEKSPKKFLDNCEEYNDRFVSDVIGINSEDKPIILEIKYSHESNYKKINFYGENGLEAYEINIKDIFFLDPNSNKPQKDFNLIENEFKSKLLNGEYLSKNISVDFKYIYNYYLKNSTKINKVKEIENKNIKLIEQIEYLNSKIESLKSSLRDSTQKQDNIWKVKNDRIKELRDQIEVLVEEGGIPVDLIREFGDFVDGLYKIYNYEQKISLSEKQLKKLYFFKIKLNKLL